MIIVVAWAFRGSSENGAATRPAATPSAAAPGALTPNAATPDASAITHPQLEERLDETGLAIEAARKAGVESGRIAFLSAHPRDVKPDADRMTQQASKEVVPTANIEASEAALAAARRQADSDARMRLLKNGEERLQQDRLIEPAGDSAKYYFLTLRGLEPNNSALEAAMQELGSRLVAKARQALALEQYAAARRWLDEASSLGFASAESTAARQDLDTAVNRQQFLTNVAAAGDLKPIKSVKPEYPKKAELAKVEGWVELDFTVAESGQVTDVAVHATSAPGVFESAAIGALSQWRYKPIVRDGKPVAQRARIRMRFAL